MSTARSTKFLFFSLLIFCCPHHGRNTLTQEMNSLEVKVADIMERMTRMEEEMIVRDELIRTLKKDLKNRDEKIANLESVVATNYQKMNPTFAFQCASQNGPWSADDSIITYERLIFDEISGGSLHNISGGLDIRTGVFTVGSGYSGIWSVSYTVASSQRDGDVNYAYLYLNGQRLAESRYWSYYRDSDGSVSSLGSRTLYMRLKAGDEITLRAESIYALYYITLCFQLAQAD